MSKRTQPLWEQVAIFFAIAGIWPALLRSVDVDLGLPPWVAYGLMGLALALMVVVFIRRIRRLRTLIDEGPDDQVQPPVGGPPRLGPKP